jgi:carboxypeptidase family protein/Big-like domain-containing protein
VRPLALLLAASLSLPGCGRLLSAPDAAGVKSLLVAGTPPTAGTSAQFTAVAVRGDGTSDAVTTQAMWRSSNTAVATVSSAGVVTAEARGSVAITAIYSGVKGALTFDVAAAGTLTLSGTVSDATTKGGIAGATVVARDASGSSKSTVTGNSGRYSIAGLRSGALDVSVRADGYTTSAQSATISADLTIDVVLARVTGCATIGFDGLTEQDARFTGYSACGFTVTPATSNWTVSRTFGHPAPFIQFAATAGLATAGEVVVTAGGDKFRLQSIDVYSSGSALQYTLTGTAGGTAAFSVQNSGGTFGVFTTVSSNQATASIDALVIRLSTAVPCCSSQIGLDNIVLVR